MKLKNVPARQGLLWVRAGLRVFGRQPLGFSSLFAVFGLAVFVLVQIPLLGSLVALGLVPMLTMAFMLGTLQALQGKSPHPGLFIPLLRDTTQRRRLLQVGGAYVAALMLVVLLSHVLDGGRLAAAVSAMADSQANAEAALQDPALAGSMLMRAALVTVVSLLFWHTPALMCWGGMPLGKALFSNIVGCWHSRGALTLFGVAWVALMMAFTALVQLLFGVLGLSSVMAQAIVPMALLASTAFYASLYFSFVDTFDLDDNASAKVEEPTPPST